MNRRPVHISYHFSLCLENGQGVYMWSSCLLDLGTDSLFGKTVFVRDVQHLVVASHFHHGSYSSLQPCCEGIYSKSIQEARCDKGTYSQAYSKMDETREPISHILELRENAAVIQNWFQSVNAAVVCAIL